MRNRNCHGKGKGCGFGCGTGNKDCCGGKRRGVALKDAPMHCNLNIVGYANCDKHYRQKLYSLGLVRGESLKITKKAPLGDPIELSLNGSNVSVRAAESSELIVDVEE